MSESKIITSADVASLPADVVAEIDSREQMMKARQKIAEKEIRRGTWCVDKEGRIGIWTKVLDLKTQEKIPEFHVIATEDIKLITGVVIKAGQTIINEPCENPYKTLRKAKLAELPACRVDKSTPEAIEVLNRMGYV